MKYIITENRLNQIVKNYLNSTINTDDIKLEYVSDSTGWGVNGYGIEYYLKSSDDEEPLFRKYDTLYWDDMDFRKKLSPILYIENRHLVKSLNSYFGEESWKEGFKEWFLETFDEPVKTIDLYQ